jgi:hypothetical protein
MLKRAEPLRRDAERRLNEMAGTQIHRRKLADNLARNRRKAGFLAANCVLGWAPTLLPGRNKMTTTKLALLCAAAVSGFAMLTATVPAQALTAQECSAKYQAAKTAGTLNGQKWNDFRKAECGSDAAAAPAAAPAAPKAAEAKPAAAPPAAAPAPMGNAVFPNAVDPKYSKETAGKARMHTCVDQYNANKAGSGNGGLKWIQKGGGYYSECTKKLKGAA